MNTEHPMDTLDKRERSLPTGSMRLPSESSALGTSFGDVADVVQRRPVDLRMVLALAGDRELNAREQLAFEKLRNESGESLYADVLYALTRRIFPSRQAKMVWADVVRHRATLAGLLGRDPGIIVAAHDYLTNVSGLMKGVGLIEENKFNALATVASRDGLTGLYDKATFHRLLQDELNRQARHNRPCTLLMADIDHFKQFNDTYGHADGDLVLQQTAEVLAKMARVTDIPGRMGGEEFGIVLPETDSQAGAILAERLRVAVEERFVNTPYQKVTMSFGVAGVRSKDNQPILADQLIRLADKALYDAKHRGRNQVAVAAEAL